MGKGGRKDATRSDLQMNLPTSQSADPKAPQGEEGSEGGGSDLEELPELKPMVASSLQGLPETSDEEGEKTSPEPNIMDFAQWVPWKAERGKTPDW